MAILGERKFICQQTLTSVPPIIKWQTESEAADQGEKDEPRPTKSSDRISGEVCRQDPEHKKRLNYKGQGELVVDDIAYAGKFSQRPIDKKPVRDEQSEKSDKKTTKESSPAKKSDKPSATKASSSD